MKTSSSQKKGFTLVEMTVAIIVGLALSSAGMTLLNQQVGVVSSINRQNFILKDAPGINQTLTSILSRADAIRLHNTLPNALADTNPVTTNGTVLVAAFRNANNTTDFGFISFNAQNNSLGYYYTPAGAALPIVGNPPDWNISRNVAGANFSLVNGLFQLTLNGPAGEVITYTVSPNQ